MTAKQHEVVVEPALSVNQIYIRLREATAGRHVDSLLRELGILRSHALGKTSNGAFQWVAFGNNQSNVSSIGLATDPGRALVERITNAEDACFEGARPKGKPMPKSPREAAEKWFGRPQSGTDTGLYQWKYGELDSCITVHIRNSDAEWPTIDVEDRGIGIRPMEFQKTILSLQASNKINKLYLAGVFGQGGAASMAFAKYTIIWSRPKDWGRDEIDKIGFTVIRELELSSDYKENAYAYLADAEGHVLWIETPPEEMEIHGTTVRHVEYRLGDKLNGMLISSPGNLYHALSARMFDPLLPFRVWDHRDTKRERNEVVTGARNRLMKLVEKGQREEKQAGNKSQVVHYHPMEYVMVGEDLKEPTLGLEYWVTFNWRKTGTEDGRIVLRSQSNDLYIMTNYPIVATVNGQVHGELSSKYLRDIGLPLVSKHIIIHLDATKIPARVRRELFATTREGFKEGPFLTEVMEHVLTILKEDDKLYDLERQLGDAITSRENLHTRSEVKSQINKLLSDSGLPNVTLGPRKVRGTGKEVQRVLSGEAESSGEGSSGDGLGVESEVPPFLAAPFPEVTIFDPKCEVLEIPQGKAKVVTVLSDASREFMDRGLIAIRTEPELLDILSFAAPKTGGFSWRVRPVKDAEVGADCTIIASITKPDGVQMQAKMLCQIVAAPDEGAEEGVDRVPEFEVLPISPSDIELWSTVWPELVPGKVTDEELRSVAYRALMIGDALHVYYSNVFTDYAELTEKYASRGSLISAFNQEYEIWTGLHAIMQHMAREKHSGDFTLENEVADQIDEDERKRVGKMLAKSSLRAAHLRLQAEKAVRAGGE